MPNTGGGKENKGMNEEKVDGLCPGGYEGKMTVPGQCAGQERVQEESEQQPPLATRDNLKKKKEEI